MAGLDPRKLHGVKRNETGECRHVKYNDDSAVVGQRVGTQILFMCQYCQTTWNQHEIPLYLVPTSFQKYSGGAIVEQRDATPQEVKDYEAYLKLPPSEIDKLSCEDLKKAILLERIKLGYENH